MERLSPKQVLKRYVIALAFFVNTLALIKLNMPIAALLTGVATVAMAFSMLRRIL